MPVLTIITPVYDPPEDHLMAAYRSVAGQRLPDGWDLEWRVQEDGKAGRAQEILPSEDWIVHGGNRHRGQAMTRNLALSGARGELVKNLDQDDLLCPGTVARDISCLTDHPDVGWSTSRVLDLMPDGSLVEFGDDPEPGRIETGWAVDYWRTHNFRLPVHPTTLCIRTQLAVAMGGWMAVPGSEDTGLLVAASTLTDGWFHDEVGLHYRKHEGQESAAAAHTEAGEWTSRMSLISQRADALLAVMSSTPAPRHT